MRRMLAISLTSLLLVVGLFVAPAQGAVKGPACTDIGGGSGSYYQVDALGDPAHEAILFLQFTTAAPLCSFATLSVYVSTDNTNFVAYTYPGDSQFATCGSNCLTFRYSYGSTATTASDAPAIVYVYMQTTIRSHTADSGPSGGNAVPFTLCDHDTSTTDYDDTGSVILSCNPPGGNYFE